MGWFSLWVLLWLKALRRNLIQKQLSSFFRSVFLSFLSLSSRQILTAFVLFCTQPHSSEHVLLSANHKYNCCLSSMAVAFACLLFVQLIDFGERPAVSRPARSSYFWTHLKRWHQTACLGCHQSYRVASILISLLWNQKSSNGDCLSDSSPSLSRGK